MTVTTGQIAMLLWPGLHAAYIDEDKKHDISLDTGFAFCLYSNKTCGKVD